MQRPRFQFPRVTLLGIALMVAASASSCQRGSPPQSPNIASAHLAAGEVQAWQLPSDPGAAQPDLVATRDGRLLLSWISSVPGRRRALEFSAFGDHNRWHDAPRTVVVGNSLVASWANPPHLMATADGALWVHWLQKAGDDPEAADIALSRSIDGGVNWSPPALVNNDGTATEHGFAALWPATIDTLGVAWLDGRASAPGAQPSHAMHGDMHGDATKGAMSLRAALFDGGLRRSHETEIDAMTCDCCESNIAMTARGPLLAYRDRDVHEIRDIAVVRFDGERWSAPTPVHADHWTMPGCPVNGPAIAALGNNAVVGWYTGADAQPRVELARSTDAGAGFAPPVVVDHGSAVLGRVAVGLDARQAWIAWLREDASGQSLWLARYAPDLSRELQRVEVAKLQARGQASGYPRMALRDGNAWLVWTDAVDGAPQLRGATIGGG